MVLQVLALSVCLNWGAAVVVRDLAVFKISNSSIIWGIVLVWPALYFLNLRFHLNFLLITTFVLLLGFTSLIGMGDVKLILVLAPWINQGNFAAPIALLIAISWLQLIAMTVIQREFPKRIAFAPAILLASALNMAT